VGKNKFHHFLPPWKHFEKLLVAPMEKIPPTSMVAGKVVCNVKQREAHEWESRGFRPKIHLPPTEERTVPIAVFENSF